MKFLVDAQLPKSLSDFLRSKSIDCIHTLELPKANDTTDNEILILSSIEERVVITKDSDFLETYLVRGLPKKLIIMKTGNIRNKELINLIYQNLDYILNSIEVNNLIEINKNEIIIHQ